MAADSAVMDAQNQGPTILAICWLLVIIPGLMVGLRLWCKLGLSKGTFGWDDSIICVAWVCLYTEATLITSTDSGTSPCFSSTRLLPQGL